MTSAPYNIDAKGILAPSLPNEASLVDWTVNIAEYIDSLPQDVRLTVIAHSFGGTSILFLLIVARHVREGDLKQWASGLSSAEQALAPIMASLLLVPDPDLFVRAASRLKDVFLYHAALGGGCHACACGEAQVPLVCDDSVRDMCALGSGEGILFSADEIAALNVPVVDIYGTHALCLGQCFGAPDTDGMVQIDAQRLFLSSQNYHEIDGGAVCHLDFIINLRHAAEDLVSIVFSKKGGQVAAR